MDNSKTLMLHNGAASGSGARLRVCLRGARAVASSTRARARWADLDEDKGNCCTPESVRDFKYNSNRRPSAKFDFGVEYFQVPAYSVIYGRHPREFVFTSNGRMLTSSHEGMDVHDLTYARYSPNSAFWD